MCDVEINLVSWWAQYSHKRLEFQVDKLYKNRQNGQREHLKKDNPVRAATATNQTSY